MKLFEYNYQNKVKSTQIGEFLFINDSSELLCLFYYTYVGLINVKSLMNEKIINK